ncbi:phage baseplate assembly protein V [uncultured Pigmentiphaga sp.]|uniref:phage baseplate assembly protein V n=1 Tax=uncultured Pigmentiphaga sp. TaxID=340361 RepID=UPI002610E69A|nr:phage baseplate assembly protein V [uncultured Pigmentiphaga sp.]
MSDVHHLDDSVRAMIRRARLVSLDDGGGQQMMSLAGLKGDRPGRVPRVQPYGFTSNPPAGSVGVILSLGGRSDRAMVIGVEHEDYRPRNLPAGATAIYDQHGNMVSLVEQQLRVVHAQEVVIEAPQIVLQAGGSQMTISASGADINAPSLRHNGRNVGATHVHTNVQPGTGTTGEPAT